jgi:hypothetical protein
MEPKSQLADTTKPKVIVRPLQENDLPAADHVMWLAFGTFLGLPTRWTSGAFLPVHYLSAGSAQLNPG